MLSTSWQKGKLGEVETRVGTLHLPALCYDEAASVLFSLRKGDTILCLVNTYIYIFLHTLTIIGGWYPQGCIFCSAL